MGKNLILTSNSFPGLNSETFLVSEYPYLKSYFKKIYVSSYRETLPNANFKEIDCISLPKSQSTVKTLIINNFGLLFKAWFLELIISKKPFFYLKNFKRFFNIWIGWLQEAEAWSNYLNQFKPSDTTIYSYWYENQAIPLTILRAKGKLPFHWVSRAHGWDVDKRQRADGIIPFRHWMLKNPPDNLASISKFGSQIFTKDYSADADTFRLGTSDLGIAQKNNSDILNLVAISSLINLKRVSLMLKSLQRANQQISLTIYGDGPNRSALESLEMPENISISFKGYVEHEKMLIEIKKAGYHLMLHTSKLEGIPVSIMECMSMGIPSMACNTGGVSELVDDENGWLLPVKITPETLAKKLDHLANNKDIIHSKGVNARAKWEQNFQASVNFPRFIEEVLLSNSK